MSYNFDLHLWHMDEALKEAHKAFKDDEVPIGAVIVDKEGTILAKAHNQKEKTHNPCGHAEILALQEACKKIGNWRLVDCTLYVTLEPCPMCLNALLQARIGKVVFGAYDRKGGAISLNYNFYKDKKLNHNFPIIGGIKHYECSKILSTFFKEKRISYQKN